MNFWGRGVAWLTCDPVKVEITGSNPAVPATFRGVVNSVVKIVLDRELRR